MPKAMLEETLPGRTGRCRDSQLLRYKVVLGGAVTMKAPVVTDAVRLPVNLQSIEPRALLGQLWHSNREQTGRRAALYPHNKVAPGAGQRTPSGPLQGSTQDPIRTTAGPYTGPHQDHCRALQRPPSGPLPGPTQDPIRTTAGPYRDPHQDHCRALHRTPIRPTAEPPNWPTAGGPCRSHRTSGTQTLLREAAQPRAHCAWPPTESRRHPTAPTCSETAPHAGQRV
ncbi:unnamed protein product [Arctogadus glacialis]